MVIEEFHPKFELTDEEKQRIDSFKDLIITNEGYRDTPFAHAEGERSYIFEVSNGNKKIVYFGSSHTNDPEDPLFTEIKKKFEETNPDIIYIEGWEAINTSKDKVRERVKKMPVEDAILDGESHFTLKLGVDAGTDFESPEPDFSQEILYLLDKGFSKKDIFTYYIYRDIDQYQRKNKERSISDCKKYLEPHFSGFRRDSGWDESELASFEAEIIGELDVNDKDKYNTQVDPIPWEGQVQTVLNEISRNSSDFRDRYIFERIVVGFKNHDRLFVVYGSAHAVKQEPAIRALLSQ